MSLSAILQVIDHSIKLKRSLALVLIHDLLFTKRGITVRNDVPLKQCVIRHQARLKAELTKIKVKRGVTSNDDLVSQKVKDAGIHKLLFFFSSVLKEIL